MQIYSPADRPDVEVDIDGTWYAGELRGWWDRGGRRLMNVQWREGVGMTRLETVNAERIRPA